MMIKKIKIALVILFLSKGLFAQTNSSSTLNYPKIYGLALNADIPQILKILDTASIHNKKDSAFKSQFEQRFKYETDRTDYFIKPDTTLNGVNRVFQDYWRKSMLNGENNDLYLADRLFSFLNSENLKKQYASQPLVKDSLQTIFTKYINAKGYQTTGYGKTGSLYDFLVWKTQLDTTYVIPLIADTAHVNIYFMDKFVSLGWEEYATFGYYYPGGWATPTALYCVKKAYDIHSESFYVNYLAHEGQHFLDYKHFPNLSSNDLEYRAKLIELYLGDKYIYKALNSFINGAKYDKTNSHSFAGFCLMRDLSRLLFHKEIEPDIYKWKTISINDIHEAAKKLFLANTAGMNKKGKDLKEFIE